MNEKNEIVADVIGNVKKVLQVAMRNCNIMEENAWNLKGETKAAPTLVVCNTYAAGVLREVAMALGIELEEE